MTGITARDVEWFLLGLCRGDVAMASAVRAVVGGEMSVREAAGAFKVGRSGLHELGAAAVRVIQGLHTLARDRGGPAYGSVYAVADVHGYVDEDGAVVCRLTREEAEMLAAQEKGEALELRPVRGGVLYQAGERVGCREVGG